MYRFSGFTLLEVLLAGSVGLVVVFAAATGYRETVREIEQSQAFAVMSENVLWATSFLTREIRAAGSMGKISLTDGRPIQASGVKESLRWIPQTVIQVFPEGRGLSSSLGIHPQRGTDVLILHGGYPETAAVLSADGDRLFLNQPLPVKAGEEIIVSGDRAVVLRVVQRIRGSSTSPEWECSESFLPQASAFGSRVEVGRLRTRVFFIGATVRKNRRGEAVLALYQQRERGYAEELLPGVIGLTVSALVRGPGGELIRVRPTADSDARSFAALEVEFLLQSEEEVFRSPRGYRFHDRRVIPRRGYLYQGLKLVFPTGLMQNKERSYFEMRQSGLSP